MLIEPKKDLNRVKEVKVRIPVTYHIKLHSMKVLTGKQISDTVTEALAEYFGGMTTPIPDVGVPELQRALMEGRFEINDS